jgi:hypothetical protein
MSLAEQPAGTKYKFSVEKLLSFTVFISSHIKCPPFNQRLLGTSIYKIRCPYGFFLISQLECKPLRTESNMTNVFYPRVFIQAVVQNKFILNE